MPDIAQDHNYQPVRFQALISTQMANHDPLLQHGGASCPQLESEPAPHASDQEDNSDQGLLGNGVHRRWQASQQPDTSDPMNGSPHQERRRLEHAQESDVRREQTECTLSLAEGQAPGNIPV